MYSSVESISLHDAENDVDGEAFLEVTEELFSKESPFKEMKITWGLKQKILKLVKVLSQNRVHIIIITLITIIW